MSVLDGFVEDFPKLHKGSQVTFQRHGIDIICEIKGYLGDDQYVLKTEDDEVLEMDVNEFEVVED